VETAVTLHAPKPLEVHVKLRLFAPRAKNLRVRWAGPCIYKVREVKSPYHQVFRGNRILVALPNMEGRRPFTDQPAPSFLRPYLIFQTSDYIDRDLPRALDLLRAELLRRGFTSVEESEEYTARMMVRMSGVSY
jgi:hypothetical protein